MASECIGDVGPSARTAAPPYLLYGARLGLNVLGLFLFALGIVLNLRSGLGLGPWDVLHQGLSRHAPITFGQAGQLVGAVLIVVGLLMGIRPGVGTVLNMLLIGFFVDRILGSHLVPAAAPLGIPAQLVVDVAGVLLVGLGSGLYIRANLGAGPRDGLMLGLHRLTRRRIAVVRGALELTVAAIGFTLGGTLGVGTLIFAFGIGPAVELGFRVCGVPTRRRHGQESRHA